MATKKPVTKTDKIEREYVIPLRHKTIMVPRYKKANKAIRTIKEFLVRHMKIRDRDLNKIKIDSLLNETVWSRGIKKPPHKIKVKVIQEVGKDEVRVELVNLSDKLKFKKLRLEKRDEKAGSVSPKKAKKEEPQAETTTSEEEKKVEEKEKKSAVVEAGKQIEKAAAKKVKHEAKAAGKMTQQKHQQRKALAK